MEINLDNLVADTYLPLSYPTQHNRDVGGRSCTKSSKNAIGIIMTMLTFENCETMVIRQDAVHHRNTTLRELLTACSRLGLKHKTHYTFTTSPMLIRLYNGSAIYFGALNDHESLKGYKPSVGKYFGILWFFEFTEFKNDYVIQQAISTFSRGEKKEIFKCIYEANPSDDPYHWSYEWIKKTKGHENFTDTFKTYLDLTEYEKNNWLGKYILKEIETLKQIDIDQYNHIYLGLPRILEDAIYKNKPKLCKRPDKFDYIMVGLDYGESDATSCVAVGVKDDKYYIFKQYYHNGRKEKKKTIIEYKTEIAKWINDLYEEEKRVDEDGEEMYTPTEFYIETSPMTVYSLFTSDYEVRREIKIYKVDKTKTLKKSSNAIQERIDITNIMINSGVLFICDEKLPINKAFSQAVYKNRKRLDDGTTDIDSLDSFEYAIKKDFKRILKKIGVNYG